MRGKPVMLLAIAAISLIVLILDAPVVFFWLKVHLNKAGFWEREFVFKELKLSPASFGTTRLLAFGSVNGREEAFGPWREYGSQAFFEGKPAGEKWYVYYNSSAPGFKIYGKSFRMLSRSEFDAAVFNLFWHLLAVCLPSASVLTVSLIYFRRANEDKPR